MLLFALIAAAALVSEVPAVHQLTMRHQGAPIHVRYDARVTTRLQQVGMSAGTRMSTERCLWTSQVDVRRHVGRPGTSDTLSKTLPHASTLSGSRHGTCTAVRERIEADVASRDDHVRDHVMLAAARDRSELHADLAAASALAMN